MFTITKRRELNPTVTWLEIKEPSIAAKAQPGQFVILRVDDDGERIPLTIAGTDAAAGTVTIIFQIVGATTERLNHLKEGDALANMAGPLGNATKIEGSKVCIVGGGVGTAIAWPVAKKFHEKGITVHSVIGYRNKDLVILEDEFRACSDKLVVMSDDGSHGEKGLVTEALKRLIESGEKYDEVIAIGPVIMMKFVCDVTKPYGIKTSVSMNPIMIDGTGMCGGCRLTVGGKTKFACVDGPDFDGHEVDFDEAIRRGAVYKSWEIEEHKKVCNLFKGVE
ncbi:sulfide/dihydroorotate dehydrogenase-like FAD/NAD-binding protein [Treponema sp. OttesenSCG-928-L16]|nr:sulfide/dihydroorotate dehydrogenase-like FAD/NAD-binding protein [Treponema sp. OttesenSCG-928-L16]